MYYPVKFLTMNLLKMTCMEVNFGALNNVNTMISCKYLHPHKYYIPYTQTM